MGILYMALIFIEAYTNIPFPNPTLGHVLPLPLSSMPLILPLQFKCFYIIKIFIGHYFILNDKI